MSLAGVPFIGAGVGAIATVLEMPLPKAKMAQMLYNLQKTEIGDARMFPFLRRGMYESGKLENELPPLPPFIGAAGVIQQEEDKVSEKARQKVEDEQQKKALQSSLAAPPGYN